MVERLLSPAVKDQEIVVKARALNLLALVVAAVAPAYALLATITTPGQITVGAAIALGAAFVLSLACYWLGKQGRVQLAAYIFFAGLFVAISFYVADPGNKISDLIVAPILYILIVLPAGYVIHPLASFIVTTLAALYIAGYLTLAPPAAYSGYEDQASFWSNVVLAFALSYILSAVAWVFSQGIRHALYQARQQTGDLQEVALELEQKRQIQAAIGQQILDLAERLTQYSSSQARGSSRQAAAITQVSSSVEELESAAREIADNASIVDQAARQTLQGAQEGQEIVLMNNESMARLDAKAQDGVREAGTLDDRLKQISHVATIMSDIASQIQLVAFNATLEAAEAGESGRRFGVVAAEVKDLAASSLKQAKQVAEVIHRVQEAGDAVVSASSEQVQAIQMGSDLMSRSNAANRAIIESATQMAEQAAQIQQATAKQQQASEQVGASMQEIKAVVDRWVVSSYRMDDMVASLRSLAEQLAGTDAISMEQRPR
jgi:methyl-accepting chemotaxis protein